MSLRYTVTCQNFKEGKKIEFDLSAGGYGNVLHQLFEGTEFGAVSTKQMMKNLPLAITQLPQDDNDEYRIPYAADLLNFVAGILTAECNGYQLFLTVD